MPPLPICHARSCHLCLQARWGQLSPGPGCLPWPWHCFLPGSKASVCAAERECEMASDRRLREVYTSKWVKAAAKSIITMCLFSLYLQAKIGKNLRIQAKAVWTAGI